MRHYGSCSHVVDTESKQLFDQFAEPKEIVGWSGKKELFKNEITVEGDRTIVHVHPFRYFACVECIVDSLTEEDYLR